MGSTFEQETLANIQELALDPSLREISRDWIARVSKYGYSYNFTWLGRPIMQFPQDIWAMQEIVWRVKPDLIIETGIAHGGSLIFYASVLELIGGQGRVLGIDVDIRQHNRIEIEKRSMFKRISMIQGSSVDSEVMEKVRLFVQSRNSVLIALDSNHSRAHVLRELELYSPFVTKGSYLIVLDTIVEEMPNGYFADRPWGKGNSPKTAVRDFLKDNDRFCD